MSYQWTVINLTPSTNIYNSYYQAQEDILKRHVFDRESYNFYIIAKVDSVVKLMPQKTTIVGSNYEEFCKIARPLSCPNSYENLKC